MKVWGRCPAVRAPDLPACLTFKQTCTLTASMTGLACGIGIHLAGNITWECSHMPTRLYKRQCLIGMGKQGLIKMPERLYRGSNRLFTGSTEPR